MKDAESGVLFVCPETDIVLDVPFLLLYHAPRISMTEAVTDSPTGLRRQRIATLALLFVLVPVGFGAKYYPGPGAEWVNHSVAGVFYEIFFCLAALFVWPRADARRIAVVVFLATCGLEFLQLWHPPFLVELRKNFFARALLGSTFSWSDFPYYAIGSAAGWWIMTRLQGGAGSQPIRKDPTQQESDVEEQQTE